MFYLYNDLEIKNISISYGKRKIIDDINYKFPSIGMVSLIGRNGSGKSTLLNAIIGRLKYQGEVNLEKENMSLINLKLDLFMNLTLRENIMLVSSNQEEIDKYLNLFNLKSFLDKKVKHLSKGEKQKSNIMVNLLLNAPILLIDEGTSYLDRKAETKFFDFLKNEYSKNHLIIFATNYIPLSDTYSDVILRIIDKKLEIIERVEPNRNVELKKGNIEYNFKILLKSLVDIKVISVIIVIFTLFLISAYYMGCYMIYKEESITYNTVYSMIGNELVYTDCNNVAGSNGVSYTEVLEGSDIVIFDNLEDALQCYMAFKDEYYIDGKQYILKDDEVIINRNYINYCLKYQAVMGSHAINIIVKTDSSSESSSEEQYYLNFYGREYKVVYIIEDGKNVLSNYAGDNFIYYNKSVLDYYRSLEEGRVTTVAGLTKNEEYYDSLDIYLGNKITEDDQAIISKRMAIALYNDLILKPNQDPLQSYDENVDKCISELINVKINFNRIGISNYSNWIGTKIIVGITDETDKIVYTKEVIKGKNPHVITHIITVTEDNVDTIVNFLKENNYYVMNKNIVITQDIEDYLHLQNFKSILIFILIYLVIMFFILLFIFTKVYLPKVKILKHKMIPNKKIIKGLFVVNSIIVIFLIGVLLVEPVLNLTIDKFYDFAHEIFHKNEFSYNLILTEPMSTYYPREVFVEQFLSYNMIAYIISLLLMIITLSSEIIYIFRKASHE